MIRGVSEPCRGTKILTFLFRSSLVCSSLLHLRSSQNLPSAKFGCSRQFSEASTRGRRVLGGDSSAGQAPYLLEDGRGGRYLVEHSIGSCLYDFVEVPWP